MKVVPCSGLLEAESCQHAADGGIFTNAGAVPEATNLIPQRVKQQREHPALVYRKH